MKKFPNTPKITTSSISPPKERISEVSILNIENNQYDASKGYPEEGRSFKLSLTITQKRTNQYHEKNSN